MAAMALVAIVALSSWALAGIYKGEADGQGFAGCDDETVPVHKLGRLRDLLASGDIDGFNRARADWEEKYLELSRQDAPLNLRGLNLSGVNLARCSLGGCNFTASDLREASFREARLAGAVLYSAVPLEERVGEKLARPTRVEKADFTGAVWKQVGPDRRNSGAARFFRFVDCEKAMGIPDEVSPGYGPLARAAISDDPTAGKSFFAGPGRRSSRTKAIGRPCANPFAKIDARFKARWKKIGVDSVSLGKLPAIRVEGQFYGARSVELIHDDPGTVLVLGSPFGSHGDLYSVGPVVAVDEAHFMGNIFANAPVWFRDQSFPRGLVFGKPIILDSTVRTSQGDSLFSTVYTGLPGPAAGPKDAWSKTMLRDRSIGDVARALGRRSLRDKSSNWMVTTTLEKELDVETRKSILQAHEGLEKLKVVAVEGKHYGARSDDIVITDPDTILVLRKGFSSHGCVFSAGPIVALGDHWVQTMASKKWIEVLGGLRCRRVIALEESKLPRGR